MSFHSQILEDAQRRVLEALAPLLAERGFYLAGGTAVALHLGHRRSVDLDFFTAEPMGDPLRLARALQDTPLGFETGQTDRGTQHRPLPELLALYRQKYETEDIAHLLYALAYFDDADRQPTPMLRWDSLDWPTARRAVQCWVEEIAG